MAYVLGGYYVKSLYEKFGKGRIYLIIAIMLIALSIIVMTIIYQVKISFSIDGQRFKYSSRAYNQIIFKDSDGNKVTVSIDDSVRSPLTPSHIAGKYQVEYKDKIIKYDSSNFSNKRETITCSDGKEYIYTMPDYDSIPSFSYDVQLVSYINYVYDFIENNDFILRLLVIIPLIFLGLAGVMYPDKIWRAQNILRVRGGEPTGFALSMNRLIGVFLIILAELTPLFQ
jgi:hypothetical protein